MWSRRLAVLVVVLGVLGSGSSPSVSRAAPIAPATRPVASAAADVLILTTRRAASESRIAAVHVRTGAQVVGSLPQIGAQMIAVPREGRAAAVEAYRASPEVQAVEVNRANSALFAPTDPYYPYQWSLPKVQAASAWDVARGSGATRIAILDSGVFDDRSGRLGPDGAVGHPDLRGKVVDWVDFSGSASTDDVYGHGTSVAGVAAALINNSIGVAGVAPAAPIMNVKVLGDAGWGWVDSELNGIIWATDHGAAVINLSLGAPTACGEAEQRAVDYAWQRGVVVVAAAGNNGTDSVTAPGNCNHVVSVAATDGSDGKASYSSYGSGVTLAAPGSLILSTATDGGYRYSSGTSLAAPVVSGVAALVRSTPLGATNVSTVAQLHSSADPIPGTGVYWGNGRVNALAAVGIKVPAFHLFLPAVPRGG